jgi:hypothetical protein
MAENRKPLLVRHTGGRCGVEGRLREDQRCQRWSAVTNLEVKMKVSSIAKLTRGMESRDRVLDLARDGVPDVEIATVLTGEGDRSPNGTTDR